MAGIVHDPLLVMRIHSSPIFMRPSAFFWSKRFFKGFSARLRATDSVAETPDTGIETGCQKLLIMLFLRYCHAVTDFRHGNS